MSFEDECGLALADVREFEPVTRVLEPEMKGEQAEREGIGGGRFEGRRSAWDRECQAPGPLYSLEPPGVQDFAGGGEVIGGHMYAEAGSASHDL